MWKLLKLMCSLHWCNQAAESALLSIDMLAAASLLVASAPLLQSGVVGSLLSAITFSESQVKRYSCMCMSMCMYDGVLLAEPFETEAKEPRQIMNELSMRGRRVHLWHEQRNRRVCSSPVSVRQKRFLFFASTAPLSNCSHVRGFADVTCIILAARRRKLCKWRLPGRQV